MALCFFVEAVTVSYRSRALSRGRHTTGTLTRDPGMRWGSEREVKLRESCSPAPRETRFRWRGVAARAAIAIGSCDGRFGKIWRADALTSECQALLATY